MNDFASTSMTKKNNWLLYLIRYSILGYDMTRRMAWRDCALTASNSYRLLMIFYDSMHPIGYHFSSSPTYAPLIANLVKEAISKLQQTGTKAFVLDKEPTMVLEWVDASRRIQCILVRVTRSVTLQYPNAYFLFFFWSCVIMQIANIDLYAKNLLTKQQ